VAIGVHDEKHAVGSEVRLGRMLQKKKGDSFNTKQQKEGNNAHGDIRRGYKDRIARECLNHGRGSL